jgi:hypothetical protein
LIKSCNLSNYEIISYIYKIILNNINISSDFNKILLKEICFDNNDNINEYVEKEVNKLTLTKIIYINKNINYLEDIIISFQNTIINKDFNLFYIENNKKILIKNKLNNLLCNLLNYYYNIIDIIYIIIFYYLINIKIFKIFDFNIIFNFNIMQKIFLPNILEDIVFT